MSCRGEGPVVNVDSGRHADYDGSESRYRGAALVAPAVTLRRSVRFASVSALLDIETMFAS